MLHTISRTPTASIPEILKDAKNTIQQNVININKILFGRANYKHESAIGKIPLLYFVLHVKINVVLKENTNVIMSNKQIKKKRRVIES